MSPGGQAVDVRIGDRAGRIVLAFLATRCDGCDEFWRGFGGETPRALPSDVTGVIVTRGPGTAEPAEVERLAAGTGSVCVVMSDAAWTDYRVLGYPFLVLVDAAKRTVVAETVGFGWSDLVQMVEATGP